MYGKKIDPLKVDFIFLDKGGTLSWQKPHEDGGVHVAKELMDFLGYKGDPVEFRKILKERDTKYKNWSLQSCYEETVEKMCTDWLFPDAPDKKKLIDNADFLVKKASYAKGERIMYPEANEVVETLLKRGYRLGLISNTVSPTLVPDELKESGLTDYFEVVVLSAVERLRKPDPAIFHLACERAKVNPDKCVYVGDAPNRDVEGPRRAGFPYVVIISSVNYNPEKDTGPMREPDVVVGSLKDLLDVFPDKKKA